MLVSGESVFKVKPIKKLMKYLEFGLLMMKIHHQLGYVKRQASLSKLLLAKKADMPEDVNLQKVLTRIEKEITTTTK